MRGRLRGLRLGRRWSQPGAGSTGGSGYRSLEDAQEGRGRVRVRARVVTRHVSDVWRVVGAFCCRGWRCSLRSAWTTGRRFVVRYRLMLRLTREGARLLTC